ncbi:MULTISPECIES: hypothetical protein [Bacteria]|nr:hypothetical protein [Bacillus paranthracis]MCU5202341.1 hypothetical protein [Bacillus paranthracis]
MTKKAPPLKLGKETFGILEIEKAFLQALELYFIQHTENKSS